MILVVGYNSSRQGKMLGDALNVALALLLEFFYSTDLFFIIENTILKGEVYLKYEPLIDQSD